MRLIRIFRSHKDKLSNPSEDFSKHIVEEVVILAHRLMASCLSDKLSIATKLIQRMER